MSGEENVPTNDQNLSVGIWAENTGTGGDVLREAKIPRRRSALETATVFPSFFRPSTFRCEVGVYIAIPESIMIRTIFSRNHMIS
jgi:hypothetical protein